MKVMFLRASLVAVIAVSCPTGVPSAFGGIPVAAVQVSAGAATSGTSVPFTLTSGTLNFKVFTTNATFSCPSSSIAGSVKAGPGQSPDFGTLNGTATTATFGGTNACGFFGTNFTIAGSSTAASPWRIRADSPSTPAAGSPVSGQSTPITIYNVSLKFTASGCSFNVTGNVKGTFHSGQPSTVAIPLVASAAASGLAVSNYVLTGSSCLWGAVKGNGDRFAVGSTLSFIANNSSYNPVRVNAT